MFFLNVATVECRPCPKLTGDASVHSTSSDLPWVTPVPLSLPDLPAYTYFPHTFWHPAGPSLNSPRSPIIFPVPECSSPLAIAYLSRFISASTEGHELSLWSAQSPELGEDLITVTSHASRSPIQVHIQHCHVIKITECLLLPRPLPFILRGPRWTAADQNESRGHDLQSD